MLGDVAAVAHEVAGTAPFRIASREVDNTGIHQLGDDGGGDSHADQDQALRHAPTAGTGSAPAIAADATGCEEVQVLRLATDADRRAATR